MGPWLRIRSLYSRDRLWRWSIDILAGGALCVAAISLIQSSGPASAVSGGASATYQPPAVPPLRTTGNSGGSSGPNTVTMPVSPQDRASDLRLKQFQVSAQKIPSNAGATERCEQLVKAADRLTDYDRNRGRPVHQTFLAEADQCRDQLQQSDLRLARLKSAGEAFQVERTAKTAIDLSVARAAIIPFDQARPSFAGLSLYSGMADIADELKQASEKRLSALQDAYLLHSRAPSRETEANLLSVRERLANFDRERPEDPFRQVVKQADRIATVVAERSSALETISRLLDSASPQDGELSQALRLLSQIEDLNLLPAEQVLIDEAKNRTAKQQLHALRADVRAMGDAADAPEVERVADRYEQLQESYEAYLAELQPEVREAAEKAKNRITNSDHRLAALAAAAVAVDERMTQKNIQNLLQASEALSPMDNQRLTDEHREALSLAKRARSGVLESEERVRDFSVAYRSFTSEGCSRSTLKKLRSSSEKLTSLDFEREPRLQAKVDDVTPAIARGYCLSAGAPKPLAPAHQ